MSAVSKKQQRFFGIVRAAQKGELEDPSPEVADVADDFSVKDAKKFAKTKHKGLPEKKMQKEGKTSCPEGEYFCNDMGKCRPIPEGHKVREDGELVKEAKKFSELSTQRKPGEKKKPKKKREGYIFDTSQPPSKKVRTESTTFSKWRKNAKSAMQKAVNRKSEVLKKPEKAQDAGAKARRKLQRREYRDKVSTIIPKELEDQKNWSGFKNNIH